MGTFTRGVASAVVLVMLVAGGARAPGSTPKTETSCGDFGTSVHFEDSPAKAAQIAKKDGKLAMVLHISGHFEDPALT